MNAGQNSAVAMPANAARSTSSHNGAQPVISMAAMPPQPTAAARSATTMTRARGNRSDSTPPSSMNATMLDRLGGEHDRQHRRGGAGQREDAERQRDRADGRAEHRRGAGDQQQPEPAVTKNS